MYNGHRQKNNLDLKFLLLAVILSNFVRIPGAIQTNPRLFSSKVSIEPAKPSVRSDTGEFKQFCGKLHYSMEISIISDTNIHSRWKSSSATMEMFNFFPRKNLFLVELENKHC
jgi:hypothetical protein